MQDITVYDENNQILNYVTQWDSNLIIHIVVDEVIDEVHFFNPRSDRALVTNVTYENGCYVTNIPNILLEESLPIMGYTVTSVPFEDTYKDRAYYKFAITVRKKPQPSNRIYIYENTKDYIDAVDILEEARQCAIDAEISADRAEQAASQSGYMNFYINEDGDLIYERTENVEVDFELVNGDLILTTDALV